MQYEWPKKLDNLGSLANYTAEFFRRKSFDVEIVEDASAGISVLACPTKKSASGHMIRVRISKSPNGTIVDFTLTSKADESMRLGILSQFLGGGSLTVKSTHLKEDLEALETEFWNSIQEFIASQPGQLT